MDESIAIEVALDRPMFGATEKQRSILERFQATAEEGQVHFGGTFAGVLGGATSICQTHGLDGPLIAVVYAENEHLGGYEISAMVVRSREWDADKFQLLVQFCGLANIQVFDKDLDSREDESEDIPLKRATFENPAYEMRLLARCPDCHELLDS